MSDADCTPGREPRSVAASSNIAMFDRRRMSVWRGCRTTVVERYKLLTLDPTNNTDYYGSPYPFGMDPVSVKSVLCSCDDDKTCVCCLERLRALYWFAWQLGRNFVCMYVSFGQGPSLLWTHPLRPLYSRPIALTQVGRSQVDDVCKCMRDWRVRRGE